MSRAPASGHVRRSDATVIGVLRHFLPAFLASSPGLNAAQRRAIWAITHCRTPVMGGSLHVCACGESHFLHHSCNHRSCPQCGKADTAGWVALELSKRVGATYFMVTFTLPSQLRYLFFTEHAKAMYDVFFSAAVAALSGQLAHPKYLGALISGITAVLQTWTQVLGFHPHLHCIVPGAGISASGKVVALKNGKYLVHQPTLCRAFRQEFRERLAALGIRVDPAVWELDWGIHIQPFGDGSNAIRYLGRYVCRTAIGDSRIVAADEHLVTIRYNDRDRGDIVREETMPGVEFVRRYLLHVLPPGMRAIRRYGFCHPASKRNRERVAFHTGRPLFAPTPPAPSLKIPLCPRCGLPTRIALRVLPPWAASRGPPAEARRCA